MAAPAPVQVPAPDTQLTTPYVSVAEFRASPTWLDSSNLIESGTQAQQDNELYNVLLRASTWADVFCGQRLAAHNEFEQARVRVDRNGLAYFHPSNTPVRQIVGFSFGTQFQTLTVLSDLTQVWVEDQRGIVISMLPLQGTFSGTLQFGSIPASSSVYMFIQIQYVAGFVSTTLASTATAGSSSIIVNDATGILPPPTTPWGSLAGSTLRIWDPLNQAGTTGGEEAVAVSSAYTTGNTTLTLVNPTVNLHTVSAGAGGQVQVSEMPSQIHQAVIDMAVALMLREDTSQVEPFAGEEFGPALKRAGDSGKTAGLLDHAYELLSPYRRVR